MAQPKPLFIPWLQVRINSEQFPGVHWTNPARTEFCIPWKHALRQDSSSTDSLIFKAWAEVSGNGRAHGDPSVWKRNFRSTLRAKHFLMVTNDSNDSANPHKVFRWPEDGSSPSPTSTSSPPPSATFSSPSATFSSPPSAAIAHVESQEEEDLPYPVQEENLKDLFVCLDQDGNNILLQEENIFIGSTINPADFQGLLPDLNPQPPDTNAFPEELQQPFKESKLIADAGPVEGGDQGEQQEVVKQFIESLSHTWVEDHFKTQFKVSVFYRGMKVSENLVKNEAGFRLVYRPEMTTMAVDPQTGLTLVTLPRPPMTFHPLQISLTQQVLDGLGVGVDVGVFGPVVYSHRHGDTKAFWSRCKFDDSAQPQEVAKMEPQVLFRFGDFAGGILEFIRGRSSPSCCLYVCLGEKWPDPNQKHWEKKLVMVEVVFTSLEILKKMAEDGGASSLQSVELQISLTEMMDIECKQS